jgi:E1A-binding protein p400
VHWDYVLEEAEWMATDFQLERKWKIAAARKIARAVLRHHAQEQTKAIRVEKQAELLRRKLAAFVSREIKRFWHKAKAIIDHQRLELVAIEQQVLFTCVVCFMSVISF